MAPLGQRILVISQFYAPELIGIARYATDLCEWLASRGFNVAVITARPNYPSFEVAEGYERGKQDDTVVNGVRVIRLPSPPPRGGGVAKRILFELGLLALGALRLLREPSLRAPRVLSFCPSVLLVILGRLATPRSGRHLTMVHDIQSGLASGLKMVRSPGVSGLIRAVERFALNRPSMLIPISDRMEDSLRELGIRTESTVLPLWVNTDEIRPMPRPAKEPVSVMYSGNLGRKQGLEQLLQAAAILQAERPDTAIVIQGHGSQEENLREFVRAHSLTNVQFRPLVPPSELNASLSRGDVHLVPQLPEGADFAVPSKAYTVMAVGRPFVCTAGPGSTLWNLMEETDAFVCVPAKDPQAIANAIIRLADDPELREAMGRRGREYVEAKLNRGMIFGEFLRLIGLPDKCLQGGGDREKSRSPSRSS